MAQSNPVDTRRTVQDRVTYLKGQVKMMPESFGRVQARELLDILDTALIDIAITVLLKDNDPQEMLVNLRRHVIRLRGRLSDWGG